MDTLASIAAAIDNDPVFSVSVDSDVENKAPKNNPIFTGTVVGVSKTHVGLGNVDNTSDLLKPTSTATQTALDAKQAKFMIGTLPTGGARLFDLDSVYFRAIQAAAPLSVSTSANSHITLSSDTYSK